MRPTARSLFALRATAEPERLPTTAMVGWSKTLDLSDSSPCEDLRRSSTAASVSTHRSKSRQKRCIRAVSRKICESRAFITFGTLVTIWALTGDDLRLWLTNKPADKYFDGLVIFNIVFFSLEIALSCLGREDYFMGFFFGLDVISTLTLFLDLTVVSDALFGGDDSADDAANARSGRTARVGARIGRVVRVLRLIRIVKLYKAFSSSSGRRSLKRRISIEMIEDPDWEDYSDEVEEPPPSNTRESLVGKKLSAKTTQRTIILVLALLIVLPLLSMTAVMETPASAAYGANDVHEAFAAMVKGMGTREEYEQWVLKYIFYHNWFTGHSSSCPGEASSCAYWYYSQCFWVGIVGQGNIDTLRPIAELAQLSRDTVEAWNRQAESQDELYAYGVMPMQVLDALASPWSSECTLGGQAHFGFSVLGSEVDDRVRYVVPCPEDVRSMERETYTPKLLTPEEYNPWHFVFYFDIRPYSRREAALNILTTVFVCVVLCVASLFFASDANTLVLQPVEKMIHKVEAIRENPLRATDMAHEEFKLEQMRKTQDSRRTLHAELWRRALGCCRGKHGKSELMETVILEKTIIKLGSLLALGFGEAGANIVSQNMKGTTSGVNAMLEGRRVDCIVGNARIRNFSTATEVLQEKVMQFVNQIAEIVHGVVDELHGAVNKNNGSTFLVIWRLAGFPPQKVRKLADMSVFAFAKILGGVHRSHVLAAYRFHPGLQQRLGSKCRVNLSFGLHRGWAIEGAVGSEFKIDASYLSPNVTITTSIEHTTRIYSVSIIASQAVVALCSREMRAAMRLIDKVTFVGTNNPIELYCVDLDHLVLPVDEPLIRVPVWNTQMRYRSRQFLEDRKSDWWEDDTDVWSLFEDDLPIKTMRRIFSQQFKQVFNMGYQNYAQGEWQVAKQLLSKTLGMLRREDGPSRAILQFMGVRHSFAAPSNWTGVRHLGDLVSD
mmetsp:Transcript_83174/g.193202  ORF Transcript_83174/g.193202 Transcript_83174/m.193202 type:complete len:950 (-) Transcript_83174:163-3012(-)